MTANARDPQVAAAQGPPSGLTPPRPHDAPLNLPADRSAWIARAIAADDAEVSVSGAATAEYSAEEMDRLASIRERLAKRTPGEWSIYRGEESAIGVGSMATRQIVCRTAPPFTTLTPADIDANTDFIAHAPDDLAWLLARLDALRESSAIAAPEEPCEGGLTPDVEREDQKP